MTAARDTTPFDARRHIGRLVCVLSLLALHPAQAQPLLQCGVPLARNLTTTDVHTYRVDQPDDQVLVDVVDTSGKLGLLKLAYGDDSETATCSGTLELEGPEATIAVSDCIPGGYVTGAYTLALNVVSDSSGNCGAPLACGIAQVGTIEVLGQVNAYTFPVGDHAETVTLTRSPPRGSARRLRMRVFDPEGSPVDGGDSCDASVQIRARESGLYTVLVSACDSPVTGDYSLTWRPPVCPVLVEIGSATGTQGRSVTVGVLLHSMGQGVGGVLSDIAFGDDAPIAARDDGSPDCTLSTQLDADAAFSFEPVGCTPGVDCDGVSAFVMAAEDEKLPDGVDLFTCDVALSADAQLSRYDLVCAHAEADDVSGDLLATTCTNGVIIVKPGSGCDGDCNDDGQVTVVELLHGVQIALGHATVEGCHNVDRNGDAVVRVDELLAAVNQAGQVCSASASREPSPPPS